jgi:3-(3-hydroxy-phenyl)propionate hydroxylase
MRERARGKQSGTAADLIPPYRDGIVAAGTPGAGERFVQPRLRDGSAGLLDDQIGGGWRLFVDGTETATRARVAAAGLAAMPITIVDVADLADDGTLAAWFATRGAAAALVRPDNYVFGTTDGIPTGLLDRAQATLGLRRSAEAVA